MTIAFTPSQLANTAATSPITYRESPLSLIWSDVCLVVRLLPYAIQIVLPFPTDNRNGELYPSKGNIQSMVLHFCLFICSGCGILLAPFVFLFFPGVTFLIFVLCVTATCYFCIYLPARKCTDVAGVYMLNYGPELVPSDPKILKPETQDYPFPHEKWFFINGVMVGTFWLESAVNELSCLFERKVIGIRNLTYSPFPPLKRKAEDRILMTDGAWCLIW